MHFSRGHFLPLFLFLSITIMLLTIACDAQPASTPVPATPIQPAMTSIPPAVSPTSTPTQAPPAATMTPVAPTATVAPTPTQPAVMAAPEPTQAPLPTPTNAPSAPSGVNIDIVNHLGNMIVLSGTTVTWTDRDDEPHALISGPYTPAGKWASPTLSPGSSVSFTFELKGGTRTFAKFIQGCGE
jgi:plastocyanin